MAEFIIRDRNPSPAGNSSDTENSSDMNSNPARDKFAVSILSVDFHLWNDGKDKKIKTGFCLIHGKRLELQIQLTPDNSNIQGN